MNCKITLTEPVDVNSIVDYGVSFKVEGAFDSDCPLPCDAVLKIELLDIKGKVIRCVSDNKKGNGNLFAFHPDLTCYSDETDPGRKGMYKFGFPELMVRDAQKPYDSLKDASIKCFYDDKHFKALIVSGTDKAHGTVADDGIGYVSKDGEPFEVIPAGDYSIVVTLSDNCGTEIGRAEKLIHILRQPDRLIVRFNPVAHKNRIIQWAHENDFAVIENCLPGYLEPYLGQWFYHMGLLTMYRANDMALFDTERVHFFVYLDDPTSTSYETELAYLQTKGIVDNPEKFKAYCYDIGEAVMGAGRGFERKAKILEFAQNEYLRFARVDIVNDKAKENVFNLNCEAVDDVIYDTEKVYVKAGSRIAVTGIAKPVAFDKKYFTLKKDNTYKIENRIENVIYTFTNGNETRIFERKLMLERIDEKSIGSSVFEFYNIFELDSSFGCGEWKISVRCTDAFGGDLPHKGEFMLIIL